MKDIIQSYFINNNDEIEFELTTILSSSSHKNSFNEELSEIIHSHTEAIKRILCSEKESNIYYIGLYTNDYIRKKFTELNELEQKRGYLKSHLSQLKQLELPEQRSKEWYEMRENVLTASSLADALGKGHFNTRDDLLIDKTSKEQKPFIINDIIQWGVKYEPVATEFYEKMNNLRIVEFGLVPHPTFNIFGASPDGICDEDSPKEYIGRMLEIKCPPKRKFTHEVPKHYWMQMQGQLEVCDLEECDFLQVKIEEYSCIREYEKDVLFDNGIQHGKTSEGLPKGLVLEYTVDDVLTYKYSPWLSSVDDILNWRNNMVQELGVSCKEKWWKITRYECTLVRRDREWWNSVVPDIIGFWGDVVHYRKVGNEEVQKRINGRKRGPRKKIFTVQEPLKGYLMDSDEE